MTYSELILAEGLLVCLFWRPLQNNEHRQNILLPNYLPNYTPAKTTQWNGIAEVRIWRVLLHMFEMNEWWILVNKYIEMFSQIMSLFAIDAYTL